MERRCEHVYLADENGEFEAHESIADLLAHESSDTSSACDDSYDILEKGHIFRPRQRSMSEILPPHVCDPYTSPTSDGSSDFDSVAVFPPADDFAQSFPDNFEVLPSADDYAQSFPDDLSNQARASTVLKPRNKPMRRLKTSKPGRGRVNSHASPVAARLRASMLEVDRSLEVLEHEIERRPVAPRALRLRQPGHFLVRPADLSTTASTTALPRPRSRLQSFLSLLNQPRR